MKENLDFSEELLCCQNPQASPCASESLPSNIALDIEPSTSSGSAESFHLESDKELKEPQLQSQRDINELITENEKSSFMNHFGPDFFKTHSFVRYLQFLILKYVMNLNGNSKPSREGTQVYGNINISSAKKLFKTSDQRRKQITTKLVFWIMYKEFFLKKPKVFNYVYFHTHSRVTILLKFEYQLSLSLPLYFSTCRIIWL